MAEKLLYVYRSHEVLILLIVSPIPEAVPDNRSSRDLFRRGRREFLILLFGRCVYRRHAVYVELDVEGLAAWI